MGDSPFLKVEEFDAWQQLAKAYSRVGKLIGYNEAKAEILQRLGYGLLTACARNVVIEGDAEAKRTLQHYVLDADLWGKAGNLYASDLWETSSQTFYTRRGQYNREMPIYCTGIRVNPVELGYILEDAGVEPKPPKAGTVPQQQEAAPASEPVPSPIAKTKGGAPRKGWWDDLWIEIIRQIEAGELKADSFESASRLEYALMDIVERLGNPTPGDSTFKPTANKLFKYLQKRGGK